jgi:hypothetical protein
MVKRLRRPDVFGICGLAFSKQLEGCMGVFGILVVPVEIKIDTRLVKTGIRGARALGVFLLDEFEGPDAVNPVGTIFFLFVGFPEVLEALAGDSILMPGFGVVRRVCGSGNKQQNGASREGRDT